MRNLYLKTLFFFLIWQAIPCSTQAQTLKLLLVSDYEDRGFGPVNIRDEDIVRQMFSKIAHRLDYKFEVAYVNKNQRKGFTKQAVMDALHLTLTSPNDIMVFHYAGKGVYTRRGLSPTLKLEKPLLLDEVAKVLQAKKLKLGLILADCRNQLTSSFPIAGTRGTIIGEERSKEITRKIFLENPCQIVEIASGRRNEDFLSFKTNSVFNYSLTESYEDMLYAEDLEKINLENFVRRIDNTSKSFIPTYQGIRDESMPCR